MLQDFRGALAAGTGMKNLTEVLRLQCCRLHYLLAGVSFSSALFTAPSQLSSIWRS
jgi:hypothetical protein